MLEISLSCLVIGWMKIEEKGGILLKTACLVQILGGEVMGPKFLLSYFLLPSDIGRIWREETVLKTFRLC